MTIIVEPRVRTLCEKILHQRVIRVESTLAEHVVKAYLSRTTFVYVDLNAQQRISLPNEQPLPAEAIANGPDAPEELPFEVRQEEGGFVDEPVKASAPTKKRTRKTTSEGSSTGTSKRRSKKSKV